MTEKFFMKVDPDDVEDRERAGLANNNNHGHNPCNDACPHRRANVHYHCRWVSGVFSSFF